MGCSPSKGQLFSKKALLPTSPENKTNADLPSDETQLTEAEINTASEGLETQEHSVQGKRSSVDDAVCDAAVTDNEDATEKMLDVVRPQDRQSAQENQKEGIEEIRTKDKQGKRRKQRKQRLRRTSYAQSKAEFILKAHQAAYAYLNPSISKYESLLGLLSQAARTQRSVQTAAATAVLHYEEINQALEEMAAEGEQLLREHGHNMTWPALLKDYPPTTKPSNDLNQLPSELLQQMLLHSTVKMVSVGDSVRCLGDSSLQELADYFGSLSRVLGEKLLAKRTAEERLKRVLSRVEAAALRKPGPEDSALHSEDSGIGADNECLNGSERFRRNRGRSGSGANAGITPASTTSCSPDQQLLNANEEGSDNDDDDEDNDDDEDEDAELEDDVSGKDELARLTDKTSGSSEANSSFPPHQDQVKTSHLKRKIRRPKTADNSVQAKLKHRHLRRPKRSQSAECLCSKAEESDHNEEQGYPRNMQTSHWRRRTNFAEDHVHGGRVQTKIRRGPSARYYGLQYGSKGPFRAVPPSSPPKFTPVPPGRNAVKRLINTFSQGVEDNSRQSPLEQRPVRARGSKSCSLPQLQNSRGIRPLEPRPADRAEHLDIDSLPPPPPEMLMDSTFESSAGLAAEEGARESQSRGQRLRTLPQREAVPPRALTSLPTAHPLRPDAGQGSCSEQESSAGLRGSAPHQGYRNHNEGEHSKGFPPTTPPVSRTRLPPSCPTPHHPVPGPPSTTCPPSGKWTPSSSVSGSQSYFEARAVFCQENQPLPHTWTPSCTSTLPRPWGEPARGRPRLQTSFMGRSPSGHSSSHSEQPQPLPEHQQGLSSDACEGTPGADGSAPALDTHGRSEITDLRD